MAADLHVCLALQVHSESWGSKSVGRPRLVRFRGSAQPRVSIDGSEMSPSGRAV